VCGGSTPPGATPKRPGKSDLRQEGPRPRVSSARPCRIERVKPRRSAGRCIAFRAPGPVGRPSRASASESSHSSCGHLRSSVDGKPRWGARGPARTAVSCCLGRLADCAGAHRNGVYRLRRRWRRRRREGGGQSAALSAHSVSTADTPRSRSLPRRSLPNRSRASAGKGEQLQEDSHRQGSPSANRRGSSSSAVSRGALGLVVRHQVREDRIACGRRCEGQRRGLLGSAGVTASASTSNRLRRRPVAATAL
jgi:hypothetical protein